MLINHNLLKVPPVTRAEFDQAKTAVQAARKGYETIRIDLRQLSSTLSDLADVVQAAEANRSRAEQALVKARDEYDKENSKIDFVSKRLDVQARFEEWREAFRKAQLGCSNSVVASHQRLNDMLESTSLKMVNILFDNLYVVLMLDFRKS